MCELLTKTGPVQRPPARACPAGQARHEPVKQIGRRRAATGLLGSGVGAGVGTGRRIGRRRNEKKPFFCGGSVLARAPGFAGWMGCTAFERGSTTPAWEEEVAEFELRAFDPCETVPLEL